jgi:hypothetical protein
MAVSREKSTEYYAGGRKDPLDVIVARIAYGDCLAMALLRLQSRGPKAAINEQPSA